MNPKRLIGTPLVKGTGKWFATCALLLMPFVPIRAASGLPARKDLRSARSTAPNLLSARQALAILTAERDRYWLNARLEVDKSVTELLAQHKTEQERGLAYPKLMHGDRSDKAIALTFDDGPHPLYTPRILSILRQHDVSATFFVVGEMAERYPDLVRAETRAGHDIGNHTYHHVSLVKIPDAEIPVEIKACGDILRRVTGRAPHLFRPPGGEYDREVARSVDVLGYTMVLWTDDPGDYASPGAAVIRSRLLDNVGSGGIILLHDGIEQTIRILPGVIEELKHRGFRFVTIDEMLRHRQG